MADILIQQLPEHGTVQGDDLLIIEGQTTDKIKVSNLMANVLGDFATVETTATASKAYAVGDYIVKDGQFYKVTAAIAQGNALTVGGNIAATNVGAEVSALNNDLTNRFPIPVARYPYHNAVDAVFVNPKEAYLFVLLPPPSQGTVACVYMAYRRTEDEILNLIPIVDTWLIGGNTRPIKNVGNRIEYGVNGFVHFASAYKL